MFNLGRLKYKVELQKATQTSDGAGGVTETYSKIADLYADIKPISAIERLRQGKVQETITHEIYVRYRSDISPFYKIVLGSREFNIKGIIDIENKNRFLKISATEGEVQ